MGYLHTKVISCLEKHEAIEARIKEGNKGLSQVLRQDIEIFRHFSGGLGKI